MPILYAPPNWEPRSIPPTEVRRCLKDGYRETAPDVLSVPNKQIPISTTVQPVPVVPPEQIDARINVNTASLAQLSKLPGITTAIAKKVIAARPYSSIEDLCERFPELDRIQLEPKVSFDAAI
ncbi:phospholipase D [Leptolyngbya boryana NIES-2135]|uniref:Phospholipase D n=1 Tax=Leptolyngbya boryana NIES-2135 TaxID=1973484 RepID=A0A1Z4JEW0_LEPBY|nr:MULTISPECIES: helix-hairpin-helix domain-containing protein [Leptolyngbya]ULP32177.1 helix-hairpin-helix domain-containing protein [Leptolyngbya boryana IU 594]BAY55276.1 phospholipase D [Leptolyngbya boryana NIES-2135]